MKANSQEKMSTEKFNDDILEEDKDEKVVMSSDICMYCEDDPCVVERLNSMLQSILETYSGWKSNKEVCFIM